MNAYEITTQAVKKKLDSLKFLDTSSNSISAVAYAEYDNMESIIPVKFDGFNIVEIIDNIVDSFNKDDGVAEEFKLATIYDGTLYNSPIVFRIMGKHYAPFVPPEYNSSPAKKYIDAKGTYNVIVDVVVN